MLFVLTRFPRFVVMDGAAGVDGTLIRIILPMVSTSRRRHKASGR
jgi:hypothetical protein